jgi:hypothetical protein
LVRKPFDSPPHLARFHDLVAQRNLVLELDDRVDRLGQGELVLAADPDRLEQHDGVHSPRIGKGFGGAPPEMHR